MKNKPSDATAQRRVKREAVRTIIINVAAPYLIYILLKSRTSEFDALIVASIPPVLESLWSIVRRRRVDVMAGLVVAGIALSLVLIAMGGGPRLLLIRESFITGLFGLWSSAIATRPVGRWPRPNASRAMRCPKCAPR